jgi:hypothetical protein
MSQRPRLSVVLFYPLTGTPALAQGAGSAGSVASSWPNFWGIIGVVVVLVLAGILYGAWRQRH